MNKYLIFCSIVVLCCFTGSGPIGAEIPNTINYQGSLKETDGTPFDGAVSMGFALYDSLTDGNLLWSDTQDVSVSSGIYSVVLGSTAGNPLDLDFDVPYFLEVSVEGATLGPRQPLTSVPYAQKAAQVEDIEVSETSGRKVIHIPLPDTSKFQIGDLTDGYKTSLALEYGTLKFEGAGSSTFYPMLSMGDGTQRALYFYGYKGSKRMRLILDNEHTLDICSSQFAFDTGDARLEATSDTGVMELLIRYGKALALTGYYGDIGVYLQGVNGYIGMGGNTDPQYPLDVAGIARAASFETGSDRRWKEEIATLEDSLDRVTQLRGVSFRWKDPAKGDGPQIGLIAQEVEDIFPELVSTDGEGYKSVSYDKLAAPLIEAVKELKAESEALAAKNDDLERRLEALEDVITQK